MDSIPFLDLQRQYQNLEPEVKPAIDQVLSNSAFSGGPFVERFEQEFAQYCQIPYAVAVNSGTSALHLAMRTLDIGDGDEVIVPANTFIATAWGVSHAGGVPVFVDCNPETWNIDPKKVEEKITENTKAIVGVHLYGQPCDIESLQEIAKKYNLFFLEDSAQAHGAKYKGKRVGSFADMACFSFYPGKNLGAYGEGGAVTTSEESYLQHLKLLRNQGSDKKYYHDIIGYNERMDGIQGAVLSVKLKYLDQWNKRRQDIASLYQEGITNPIIELQKQPGYAESVYHLFVITVEDRDRLLKHLQDQNIFPGMHYPVPCHLQKAYKQLGYQKGDFPNAEYLSDHCLSLPMFPELMDEEVNRVIDALNQYQG